MMKKKNKTFLSVIIGIVACGILGFGGYYVYNQFVAAPKVGDEVELTEEELQEMMQRDDVEIEMVD